MHALTAPPAGTEQTVTFATVLLGFWESSVKVKWMSVNHSRVYMVEPVMIRSVRVFFFNLSLYSQT